MAFFFGARPAPWGADHALGMVNCIYGREIASKMGGTVEVAGNGGAGGEEGLQQQLSVEACYVGFDEEVKSRPLSS